jgi:hypothetical protein
MMLATLSAPRPKYRRYFWQFWLRKAPLSALAIHILNATSKGALQ